MDGFKVSTNFGKVSLLLYIYKGKKKIINEEGKSKICFIFQREVDIENKSINKDWRDIQVNEDKIYLNTLTHIHTGERSFYR